MSKLAFIASATNQLKKNWFCNRLFSIWTVVIVTVAVRVAASLAFKTYQFDDARDHWAFGYEWGKIANWLVTKGIFSLDGISAHTATDPLYVFTIASFFVLFGSFTTSAAIGLIVLQSVLDGLTAWVLFLLGERLYGPVEARVAALLFALYPASIFFAIGRIGPSNLTVLLLCLLFLITFKLADLPRAKLAALAGLVTGLLILTSSKPLSLIVLIPAWLFWVAKKQRLRALLLGVIFVAGTIFVMLPWAVRNSALVGYPTLSKEGLGVMLWVGNNPDATGYTYKPPPEPRLDDRAYMKMAVSWIADNPWKFLVLTLKRIAIFWSVIPGSSPSYIFNAVLFLGVTGVALAGALWPGGEREKVALLLLFFAIFPLIFYLTAIPAYRHRFHIEPLMLVVASHGILVLWHWLSPAIVVRLVATARR